MNCDRLIPLKASTRLELSERKAKGENEDAKDIGKHANDVIRLSQLLAPQLRIPVTSKIVDQLGSFLHGISADGSLGSRSLRLNSKMVEIVQRIAQAYEESAA